MILFFALLRDGLVVGAGKCTELEQEAQEAMPGFAVAWLEDEATHDALAAAPGDFRLLDGAVVARLPMPAPTVSVSSIAADGIAEAVITGLPEPCTVTLRGPVTMGPLLVADGMVTLTSTMPGPIAVTIEAPPAYLAWRTTIHAV